jgi:O-antigen biosynthesis protein
VTSERLAAAPRLIEWTGERCVPWAPDPPVIYEHFHRYLFASQLVADRDVLDLASGEGFGAVLMGSSARSVVGLEIEPRAVEHSRLNYVAPNLEFKIGDARDLSMFEPDAFGAVVAFEMIEHISEHGELIDGIARVLAPDGLLIMSTPERAAYSEVTGFSNPYHVRELTMDELLALLRGTFANVTAWAQRTVTGSALTSMASSASDNRGFQRFVIERSDDEWRLAPGMSPMYVVAVASNGELPPVPVDSVLVDPGQELLVAAETARDEADKARAEAEQARAGAEETARQQLEERAALQEQLTGQMRALNDERRLNQELTERAAGDGRVIARLQTQLNDERRFRAGVEGSVTWQLFQRRPIQAARRSAIAARQTAAGRSQNDWSTRRRRAHVRMRCCGRACCRPGSCSGVGINRRENRPASEAARV